MRIYNNLAYGNLSTRGIIPHKKMSQRKLPAIAITGLLMLGGFYSCNSEYAGNKNNQGTKIEYFNVKKSTREQITLHYFDFKSKLNKDNNFLNNVSLIISNNASDMDDKGSFKKFFKKEEDISSTLGSSFYSDNNLEKIILIQEYPHYHYNGTNNDSLIAKMLNHSLMHEIGHHFDEYFGHDHEQAYAKSLDSMLYEKEKNPNETPYYFICQNEKERNIARTYINNNTLSDKAEFKEAILKDYYKIGMIAKTVPEILPNNIGYYTFDIDYTNKITLDDVNNADFARSEVYANLFSYAMGEDGGDRDSFLNAFPNSFKIVKKDIKTFLGENFISN